MLENFRANVLKVNRSHQPLYPKQLPVRGCLHDNGATSIPGRDEKLQRVYIKPCLLGCESYSAVKLMKL